MPKPKSPIVVLSLLLAILIVRNPAAAQQSASTLDILYNTTIPPRDPVDLARRFLGVVDLPTPAPAKDYNIGDTVEFTAENNETATQFTVALQLWYETPHSYFWFETGFKPDLDALKNSADSFENKSYPLVHKYFGSEVLPGIDNDQHVYVIHAKNLGGPIAAYFSGSNSFPSQIVPGSNEHEVMYVNLDTMGNQVGSEYYNSVLTHEFQHMVHSNTDYNEDSWLNEGLSVLSQLLYGDSNLGVVNQFFGNPALQLNTWSEDTAHYGSGFLFSTYFLQRFGEDALRALVANPQNGMDGVRDVLTQLNATDPLTKQPITAEDLFADWTMANLLNNKKVGDGRFSYPLIKSEMIPPLTTSIKPSTQTLPITQWGTTYLEVSTKGTLHLKFAGQSTVKLVPTEAHSGTRMWWSNRGDQSDMKLTRAFDLTGVQKATLSFWLWYAIEKDWDYGYVTVSTDSGVTWKALPGQHSDPAGGHNNPFGPGYTGNSGGADTSVWQLETVDLSAYAGQQILLRFEYITDDATNTEGMLIDDISIPELNYSSDAETGDDGWTAEGWARIENALPAHYLVQMVEYGRSGSVPRVFRLLGPADGLTGDWTLNVGGEVSRLVISVAGLTEFTTEQASAQVVLEAGK
jgi:immune inhibitor A